MGTRSRLGLIGVIALLVSACSSGATGTATPSAAATDAPSASVTAPSPTAAEPVTFEWWHIQTADPGKTIYQDAASAYMAAHPNVTINITILENEAFKSKLTTTMQSGSVPDLFTDWGGGIMASRADASLLKDITADVASWIDEINPGAVSLYRYEEGLYGIPNAVGMIGVWYNKDLFAKAGIAVPPTTWDEFLTDVDKLKAVSIVPLAIAGKDRWVGLHLWTYLVLRIGGADAMAQMAKSGDWNTDACRAGGAELAKLVAKNPFQPGFLGAAYDKGEAAAMGNGEAAMEVMGEWAPAVQIANSTSGKGIGDKLGWFAFPTVTGGAGAATDAVGGGGGFAVGKNAPPEAIDFLHYLVSKEVANKANLAGQGLSATLGTESTITDPMMQQVLAGLMKATFVQTYLNVAPGISPGLAEVLMDGTAGLLAGTATPEAVCTAFTDAAAQQ